MESFCASNPNRSDNQQAGRKQSEVEASDRNSGCKNSLAKRVS
jgi:hypothetical protein